MEPKFQNCMARLAAIYNRSPLDVTKKFNRLVEQYPAAEWYTLYNDLLLGHLSLNDE